jgi:DNA-binding response OmpR family regulator
VETGNETSPQAETLAAAVILVIDDELAILEMLARLLTKRGYRVETANSGEEAVERIALGHDYDVILLDIFMPGQEGKATYEKIVGLRPDLTRRIVFITGDMTVPDTQVFLERTGASYVAKPFNMDELIATIQVTLQR